MRRIVFWIALCCRVGAALVVAAEPVAPRAFVHPGLLHGDADFERMKLMIARGAEPWKSAFGRFRERPESRANWKLRGPFAVVTRATVGSTHIAEFNLDGNAAYQNAVMWRLTGDVAHARKAVEILNAWSATLREINGKDKELGASLGGFKYVNAAELMRHSWREWRAEDVQRCERMLKEVVYPVIAECAPFANGNWGAGCVKTMLGIGVFCNDRAMFDRALRQYNSGGGDFCLTNYVVNADGQCQESGRDQTHAQLGLAHLAEACEIAWHQGIDLYGAADNRLLRGFEYTAKYNLGGDVPFAPMQDAIGKHKAKIIARERRGELRPVYEMVWNHYEKRRGLRAPFTQQAAEKIRPESSANGADHPGFGTLLFTLPP